MHEISLLRLYLLRAMYLLIVIGLGTVFMPNFIFHDNAWSLDGGVKECMMASFWLLSILGLRYPLQMIPVLLWELVWKTAWLLFVAAPLWSSGHMDAVTGALASEILCVIIVPFVIPWRYVYSHYVQLKGDRWTNRADGKEAAKGVRATTSPAGAA